MSAAFVLINQKIKKVQNNAATTNATTNATRNATPTKTKTTECSCC
jgi:hypothetical protein